MKKSLLRFAVAMLALAAASRTATAADCPDTLYNPAGGYTCNLLSGDDCHRCCYVCNTQPPFYPCWNTCSEQ